MVARQTAQGLVALSPTMKPADALRLLEATLAADPSQVEAVILDLTGEARRALSTSTPFAYGENAGEYFANIPMTEGGTTTHVVYFVRREPEGLLLQRGLEKMFRVEPGFVYELEITFE